MASYTPQEVKKRFDALPADIKALVYSTDMMSVLQAIGAKYQLHIDQIGELEGEAADVMTGFSKPEEFVTNLKENLNIDDVKAQQIAKDINDQLFAKIRESMKNSSQSQTASSPASVAAVATQRPAITPIPVSTPIAPSPKHDFSVADSMLAQKTVTSAPAPATPPMAPPVSIPIASATSAPKPPMAVAPETIPPKPEPPKPQNYSADPYREPPV